MEHLKPAVPEARLLLLINGINGMMLIKASVDLY